MVDETQDKPEEKVIDVIGASPHLEGDFMDSLYRNNKQIRKDRADSIGEDGMIAYKRAVEDVLADIRALRRKQDGMTDLSPTDTTSLKHAKDFNGAEWAELDIQIELQIRNLEIKYERASARLWKHFKVKV